MEELRLAGVLLITLLVQLCLLPFRLISWIFKTIESIFRVLKETVNTFIKLVRDEVKIE